MLEKIGFRYANAADAPRLVTLLGKEAARGLPLIVAYLGTRVVGAASLRMVAVEKAFRDRGLDHKLRTLVAGLKERKRG